MKEKLNAARVEIAFLVLTVLFLAAFFLAGSIGEKDVFPLFSVAVSGVSAEEDETAVQMVNINTASCEELQTLPGVGEKLAEKIVLWRQKNGPFMDKEELLLVDGLGKSVYYSLADYVTLR